MNDLSAIRKVDAVTLTWTSPTETTDGELIRKSGKILISRGSAGAGPSPSQIVNQALLPPALQKKEKGETSEARDSLDNLLTSGADFAVYTVVAQSSSGKTSGPSNQAMIPLIPTLPPPAHVTAAAVPLGISISWDQAWQPQNPTHLSAQYFYRIMRREQGAKTPVVVKLAGAINQAMTLMDTGIEWQKSYDYWITPVTSWQGGGKKGDVEGEDSAVVSVFANDTFPPAVPLGLEAVFSGITGQPFIDLSWTPNTEPDLAGYNVYRHVGDEAATKINSELVKTSSFRDAKVTPGAKYFYSVSAVDLRGNESGKSAEASESVPQQ